jgi:hypothetical protein
MEKLEKELCMKKDLLIVSFVLIVQLLPAQSLVDEPSLQPEIMTYFQDEMTSLIRFQSDQGQNRPLFGSVSFQYVKLDDEADQNAFSNSTINMFGGYQIKLGNYLYMPLYGAWTAKRVTGYPVGWVDNNYPLSTTKLDEIDMNLLAGTGLYFTAGIFSGGVFAAYHYKQYSTSVQIFDNPAGIGESIYNHKDENTRHAFKLAILPAADTSKLRYVGSILNNALGYLGMGDAVEVYSGGGDDDKDMGIAAIIAALNYGLNLGFRPIEWGSTNFGFNGFYRRDNYDAVARNDVYGGKLTISFPLFRATAQASFECGFRQFNDVSLYYVSKYHDTWFYNIDFTMPFLGYDLFKVFLRYDNVTSWCVGLTFDWRREVTGFISSSMGNKDESAIVNLGARWRGDNLSEIGKIR